MTSRDWHYLVRPVLSHAATDKELDWLQVVRIERGDMAIYAVATDQLTMGAERHALATADRWAGADTPPVHVATNEVQASLKLLTYSKDYDPELQLIIDQVPIAISPVNKRTIDSWALTLYRPDDGLRLTMRDHRDPSLVSSLSGWRKAVLSALTRGRGRSLDGLDIRGAVLGRFKDAARGTERLRLYTGPEPGQAILLTVESHFAGLLSVPQYLDSPAAERSELPWTNELLPAGIGPGGERGGDGPEGEEP